MTTTYPVKLALTLRPVWHQDSPRVRLGIGKNLTELELTETATINFEFEATRSCDLIVELLNKQDSDTVPELGLDKAVVIESISFFGISDPRFVWSGVYEPTYPEPWYSQQTTKPLSTLKSHTYLGWNGKWTLTFDVPVFTWIHQTQDLGWIYS
jgi:hypothetical protein